MTAETTPAPERAARQRARGVAAVAFTRKHGATRLSDLSQSGTFRVLFPRPEPGAAPTAVLANIGGGIAGGDVLDLAVDWGEGADAVVTTQAAEKVYRALDAPALFATRLTVRAGASAHWLPQEAILFDGAALERRLDVDMAADATLLAMESLVFGRSAHGERMTSGRLFDRWRIRRANKLVFADAFELGGGPASVLDRKAVAAGAVASASLVYAAADAEARLDMVREILACDDVEGGASAFDGLLTARLVAHSAPALRRTLARLATALGGRPLPRVFAF